MRYIVVEDHESTRERPTHCRHLTRASAAACAADPSPPFGRHEGKCLAHSFRGRFHVVKVSAADAHDPGDEDRTP